MRALVTGGAGFIGSHLVDRLVSQGHQVAVLDDFSSGRKENLSKTEGAVEVFKASVLDEVAVQRAARGCNVVFHFAAIASVARSVAEPEFTTRVNIEGTVRVLEAAAREGAKTVFSSSSAVYGPVDGAADEAMCPAPVSPYGIQKLASELFIRDYALAGRAPGISLRYFNVYGERQDPRSDYAAVVPRFLTAVANAEPLTVYGDGEQTRDFIHVDDVIDANMLAASLQRMEGQAINIGSGISISINELAQVCSASGNVEVHHQPARQNEIRHSKAATTLAESLLEFKASIGLEEGLRRTYRAMGDLSCPRL